MKKETIELLNILNQEEFFEKYEFALIGGTALSIHLNHRLSEDLDFMLLNNNDLPSREIKTLVKKYNGIKIPPNSKDIEQYNYLSYDDAIIEIEKEHQRFLINGIKVDFIYRKSNFDEDEILTHETCEKYTQNGYISMASVDSIFKQKTLLTLFDRNKIRDMFDLYTLINKGYYSFSDSLQVAEKYRNSYTLGNIEKKLNFKEQSIDDEPLDGLIYEEYLPNYSELKDFFLKELLDYKKKAIKGDMHLNKFIANYEKTLEPTPTLEESKELIEKHHESPKPEIKRNR